MKIALTIRTFYPKSGGLQAHAEKLAHELVARGHQVTILTRAVFHNPSYQDYFFFSESISKININGLEVNLVKHSPYLNWLMWFISKCIGRPALRQMGIQLIQWIFTEQMLKAMEGVDIIHHVGQAHELIGFAAAAAAQRLGVPFVVQPTLHPYQWGDSEFDFCLYRLADCLLVYTEFEQRYLEKFKLNSGFALVGSGINNRTDGDENRFRKKYKINGSMILFLGRKSADKGYILLKQAFSLVRQQQADVTLVCMGPSEEQNASSEEEGVLELGFGEEQDKHDALAACSMLCVPSEGESFGLVFMEAGLYAKPIIARKLPVLEELLGRYNGALLIGTPYGEGNQVQVTLEELSDAILRLLKEPELANQIGKNAESVASEFIWSKVVTRFEDAYHQAIADLKSEHRLEESV